MINKYKLIFFHKTTRDMQSVLCSPPRERQVEGVYAQSEKIIL